MSQHDIFGITTNDCPASECYQPICYEPCDHQQRVIESLAAKPQRKQAFLYDLIISILRVQEEFIESLCAEPTITDMGSSIGFPPVQCGYLEYCPCPVIDCGMPCQYQELTPYMTNKCERDSCDEQASCPPNSQWVDLSQGDYLPIYTVMVNWLNCASGIAGGHAVSNLMTALGGSLLGIRDGVYSIKLPDNPTLHGILPVLSRILPLPVGATHKYYLEVC